MTDDLDTSQLGRKQALRDQGGRFIKGKSGNPSGRPRSRGLVAEIRKRTGESGGELVAFMSAISKVDGAACTKTDGRMTRQEMFPVSVSRWV